VGELWGIVAGDEVRAEKLEAAAGDGRAGVEAVEVRGRCGIQMRT